MKLFPFRKKKDTEKPVDPLIARVMRMRPQTKSPFLDRRPQAASPLNFFRRRQEVSAARGQGFRQQRQNAERQRKLKDTGEWLRSKAKIFAIAGAVILVLIGAGVGIYYLHQQRTYVITDITVSGNTQTSSLAIVSALDNLRGTSLLLVSTASVEQKLLSEFPYLKQAVVRKVLPGKIEIEVVERFPVMSYINLTGVFLLDDEGVVVTVVTSNEVPALTTEEQLVFDGFGDINANYTYEKYRSKFTDEEERAAIKWEEVPENEKRAALDELKNDLVVRVIAQQDAGLAVLNQSQFAQLPRVFAVDANAWKLGNKFLESKFEISKAIIDYLTVEQLGIIKIQWQSDFTIIVDLVEGKQLLFTSTRDIHVQIQALETLRSRIDMTNVRIIDLRSELVSVR